MDWGAFGTGIAGEAFPAGFLAAGGVCAATRCAAKASVVAIKKLNVRRDNLTFTAFLPLKSSLARGARQIPSIAHVLEKRACS